MRAVKCISGFVVDEGVVVRFTVGLASLLVPPALEGLRACVGFAVDGFCAGGGMLSWRVAAERWLVRSDIAFFSVRASR